MYVQRHQLMTTSAQNRMPSEIIPFNYHAPVSKLLIFWSKSPYENFLSNITKINLFYNGVAHKKINDRHFGVTLAMMK